MTHVKKSLSLLVSLSVIFCIIPFAVCTVSVSAAGSNPFTANPSETAENPTASNPFDDDWASHVDDSMGRSAGNPFILDSVHDLDILSAIVSGDPTTPSGGGTVITSYTSPFDCSGYYFKLSPDFKKDTTSFKNIIGWGKDLSPSKLFNGIFDGNNQTVDLNIVIKKEDEFTNHSVGLFGIIGTNAIILNVTVTGTVDITRSSSSKIYAGGIVGYAEGGKIANCSSFASVSANAAGTSSSSKKNAYAGGIVGYLGTNSELSNCFSCGSVTATSGNIAYAGGVAGYNSSGSVSYCYYDNENSGSQVKKAIDGSYSELPSVPTNGLPKAQCQADKDALSDVGWSSVTGSIFDNSPSDETVTKSLVDLLNYYVKANSTISTTNGDLKLSMWGIDTTKAINNGYPYRLSPISKIDVNLLVRKPSIGRKLSKAKVVSATENVTAKVVHTSWSNRGRLERKAKCGGKYTVKVIFSLSAEAPYTITDETAITVQLNGKTVTAFKNADGTYTALYTFRKLRPVHPIWHPICPVLNILSHIRNCISIGISTFVRNILRDFLLWI